MNWGSDGYRKKRVINIQMRRDKRSTDITFKASKRDFQKFKVTATGVIGNSTSVTKSSHYGLNDTSSGGTDPTKNSKIENNIFPDPIKNLGREGNPITQRENLMGACNLFTINKNMTVDYNLANFKGSNKKFTTEKN
jgi:hypothetical protein